MHLRPPPASHQHSATSAESPQSDAGTSISLTGREQRFHWLMLLLAVSVLSISGLLHVRDGQQVLLPIWNVPLPSLCTFKRV